MMNFTTIPQPPSAKAKRKTTRIVGTQPHLLFPDIFEAGINTQEIEEIFGYPMTQEEYFMLNSSEDSFNADLWKLFSLREQTKEAEMYKAKVQNEKVRSWLGYSDLIRV
jgi:hypothetical protein